jgi:DNA-directed RNA polymerase specialized sigma24 family protein
LCKYGLSAKGSNCNLKKEPKQGEFAGKNADPPNGLLCHRARAFLPMTESDNETSLGRKRNELDRAAFDALLQALAPDRDLAGRQYEELRRRLINLFSWEQFDAADDLADDALNRLARKVLERTEIPNLDRFAFGIARMLMQEEGRRKRNRQSSLLEYKHGADRGPDWKSLDAMDRCLAALPQDRRELIERYYVEDRAALARTLGISLNALRNRALRIREELFKCVTRKRDDS